MADVEQRWTCPKCRGHVAERIRSSPVYLGEFMVMCSQCHAFIQFEKEESDSDHVRKTGISQCFDR